MKILVISNCPLDPDQGSGYVISGFVSGMRKRGHVVDAYDSDDVILMPSITPARRLRLFAGYTFHTLNRAWFGGEYDVIELWGGLGWLAVLLLTARRNRRYSVVSRSNGLEPLYREKCMNNHQMNGWRDRFGEIESWCDGVGFKTADALTVVSTSEKEYALRKRYKKLESLWQIDNPIPDEWRNQQIIQRGRQFTVGFVGSWLTRKGVNHLKDVMKKLKGMKCSVRWIIAGVGKNGKSELEKLRLEDCDIYEHTTRSQLREIYSQMDAFMCLSSYESFGMVCSEAMACGCLLISTKVGFPAGLQNGKNYIAIDASDTQRIAELLCHLQTSIDKYETVRTNGYRCVQELTWDSAISRLDYCYETLVANRHRQNKNTSLRKH